MSLDWHFGHFFVFFITAAPPHALQATLIVMPARVRKPASAPVILDVGR